MRNNVSRVCAVWAALAALAGPGAAAGAGEAPPAAGEAKRVEFPHAGVVLSVPGGFKLQSPAGAFDVMQAVRKQGGRAVQGVTLSAFPVAAGVTAEKFADGVLKDLQGNIAFRRVKLLKKTPMTVAGIPGAGRKIRYSLRGQETVAARAYFIRELAASRVWICYVLTVEAVAGKDADLLQVLGETIKTVALISLRHPAAMPVERLGRAVKDYRRGYSVRPPLGWYSAVTLVGVEMGRIDYLLGGMLMPAAQMVVAKVPPALTAEACAKDALQLAVEAATENGMVPTVISQGPAKLGLTDGYQFVLRQAARAAPATAPADKPAAPEAPLAPPVLIVQRTICASPPPRPAPSTRPTQPASRPAARPAGRFSYSLVLITQGVKPAAAVAMVEKIAPGFELFPPDEPPPATAPATRPEPATQPAPDSCFVAE